MPNCTVYGMAMTIFLGLSTGATALTMSKERYESVKGGIETEFTSTRASCALLPANARGLCRAEARQKYIVATAALEANFKLSKDGSYKSRITIADADYRVARRICHTKAGDAKKLCMKQARAVQIAAKVDAMRMDESSNANRAVIDDAGARKAVREEEERTEARRDSAIDKRRTQYEISRERCEILAPDAKIICVKDSKRRFDQL